MLIIANSYSGEALHMSFQVRFESFILLVQSLIEISTNFEAKYCIINVRK